MQLAFNSGEAVNGDWESRCGLEGFRIRADTILCFGEPARNRGEAVRDEVTSQNTVQNNLLPLFLGPIMYPEEVG